MVQCQFFGSGSSCSTRPTLLGQIGFVIIIRLHDAFVVAVDAARRNTLVAVALVVVAAKSFALVVAVVSTAALLFAVDVVLVRLDNSSATSSSRSVQVDRRRALLVALQFFEFLASFSNLNIHVRNK